MEKVIKLNKIKNLNNIFDTTILSWETLRTGPMSNSTNQALSYHVLIPDRQAFEPKYSRLKIVNQELIPKYLKYLLSGGLNFWQILPNYLIKSISGFEKAISHLSKWLALQHVIVIAKIRS